MTMIYFIDYVCRYFDFDRTYPKADKPANDLAKKKNYYFDTEVAKFSVF